MAREIKDSIHSNYFLIRVDFRQHATLQGEIEWLDKDFRKVCYFRSFLELVNLLSEALEQDGFPEAEYKLRKWQEVEEEDSSPV